MEFVRDRIIKYDGLFGELDMQQISYTFYRNGGGFYSGFSASLTIFPTLKDKVTYIAAFRDGNAKDRTAHAFVVFQTNNYYYSVERYPEGIVTQMSKNIDDVISSMEGQKRDEFMQETKWVDGKGTVGDVINLIKQKILPKKYNIFIRNCQTFAAFILKNVSLKVKTFHKYLVNNKDKFVSFKLGL
jgi:hypothetical protein